ncbi:MAG: Na+/H+ antiporter subunit C [Desulfobacterales bacterium]|jgi:multicomponent Na+:H+ antiporter subunit C
MESALAIMSGSMVAGGIYLLLSQNLVRMLFGLIMLSNAINLIIFTAGRLTHTKPALIETGQTVPLTAVANALPQALILTAIVIGFALLVFIFVLFYRSYETLGTVDPRQMPGSDPEPDRGADTTTAQQEKG